MTSIREAKQDWRRRLEAAQAELMEARRTLRPAERGEALIARDAAVRAALRDGLTTREVGEMIGYSPTSVSRIGRGLQ